MSDDRPMKYRIVSSGPYFRYKLERKGWLFWGGSYYSDNINELRAMVKEMGGELVNATPPNPNTTEQKGE